MEALNQLARDLENRAQVRGLRPITPVAVHSSILPKHQNISNCYYILTEVPALKYTPSSTVLTNGYCSDFTSAEANQISLIHLSKIMFEGSKPMQGAELSALHKAMKKQRNSDIKSLL